MKTETKRKRRARSVEKITPEEQMDVREGIKDIKDGRFKESSDPEELIAWLDSAE